MLRSSEAMMPLSYLNPLVSRKPLHIIRYGISDYCYDVEMKRALERHKSGEARVIPIILRPCDWQSSPFARLQSLPRDGKAIMFWQNQDEAFLVIAQGLRRIIEQQHVPTHPLPEVERKNRRALTGPRVLTERDTTIRKFCSSAFLARLALQADGLEKTRVSESATESDGLSKA